MLSEEVNSNNAGIKEFRIEARKGDRDADIVLAKTGAEATNKTAALHNKIKEVVAATLLLR